MGDFGGLRGKGADAFEDGARGVFGGGAEFMDVQALSVEKEEIGKGAAGVDADAGGICGRDTLPVICAQNLQSRSV